MRKRLVTFILLAIVATFGFTVSLAWFSDNSTTELGITSYVHKTYFQSGDGATAQQYFGNEAALNYDWTDCAYEIAVPVQLHSFAWLQYLGYFNQAEGGTIKQTFFYLSADLNMTGWVLPPIGTEEFPFLGNFNGNGHTISNLTIQNVGETTLAGQTVLRDVPEEIGTVKTVGLFGVVGSTSTIGNAYAAKTQQGSDYFVPDTEHVSTYDPTENEIKNFTLSNVTLKAAVTTTPKEALIGAVAGYVNATVAHADVSSATLCIVNGTNNIVGKTNISDYSVIGYDATGLSTSATTYVEIAAPTIDNTNTLASAMSGGSGGGNEWGGSINIRALNDRLYHLLNTEIFAEPALSPYLAAKTQTTIVNGKTVYSWYSDSNSENYRKNNAVLRYYTDDYNVVTHIGSGSIYAQDPNAYASDIVYRFASAGTYWNSNKQTPSQTNGSTATPGTALPLLIDPENNYSTLSGNTGYITGGMSGAENTTYSAQTTVRSSSYNIKFIGNSLSSSGTSSTAYTQSQLEVLTNAAVSYSGSFVRIEDEYNSSNPPESVSSAVSSYGRTKDSDDLEKYNAARDSIDSILTGTSKVHGLHFTGSTVSASTYTTIGTAYINGETYTDYQVPNHSLDFNLKKSGYINFFAGSYRSTVGQNSDSFFSLSVVVRNADDTLNAIHEISKVYLNTNDSTKGDYPYVYEYADSAADSVGKSGVAFTKGALAFDLQWLWEAPPVANALYYFEVPVNSGEYAMGSHGGNVNGTYLLYLDISAAGSAAQVIVPEDSIVETYTQTTYNYQYVKGVGVTAASAPDGVICENITSPTAALISKTVSVAAMTAASEFVLPDTDTVTDSAAVVKYLGKTEVITQKTTMTGTVDDVSTTVVVTKTTTRTYDSSGTLTGTVNTISATKDGAAADVPNGFSASALTKPAVAVAAYHFYNPGGVTVGNTTDATVTAGVISVTEYIATVSTDNWIKVIVDTVPAGNNVSLKINGNTVAANAEVEMNAPAP